MFHLSLILNLRQLPRNILYTTRFTHTIYPLTIREIYDKKPLNQSINLIGYLLNVRKLKTHYFLDLFDGSLTNNQKHLQVVASLDKHPHLPHLTYGCSINVQGKLVRSDHPKQEFELQADNINLINSCDASDYPFKPKFEQTLLMLRQNEHLRLRSTFSQVIFRLRSQLMFSLYEYFFKHNFIHIQTPCLTQNDCEGGGETFQIQPYQSQTTRIEKEYFNKQVYLTVSGQLHLETAANGFGRVYTLNPAFRADKNLSRFHLAEFWMLEVEVAGLTKLDQLLNAYIDLLRTIVTEMYSKCSEEFKYLVNHKIQSTHIDQFLNQNNYPRISYKEAVEYLRKSVDFQDFPDNGDFNRAHENYLCQNIMNNQAFFIINYPKNLKPFYMLLNDDDTTVANFDFIFPSIGELSGGSLREHRYENLKLCLDQLDITNELQWYLDLRRFGGMPTGGFGLGIERFLMAITGIDNVRDVILFPRFYQHCDG
ncbi:unnamed protein product [Rotaria sp. Silwood1]|nr:unnamed protein product [Rotaria sp. Silwood1]CAF0770020.1 unnamed protein product [Rotaria sp. Silwood1]CAF3323847.1 unnamed protein product [Rotaria sp. Silwood1]CAF4556958.1 unnamed protein product [Rotaria sp. Silwood1]